MALRRAEGWLELRRPLDANEELDEIQPQLRAHPAVLKLRYAVCCGLKKWDLALEIANHFARIMPNDAFGGTHAGIALHKLGRTREAKELTLSLAARFNEDYSIAYNLACYCAQLGEIQEAQGWFETAMSLDADTVRRVALDDPDLDPIWKATKAPPASPGTTRD